MPPGLDMRTEEPSPDGETQETMDLTRDPEFISLYLKGSFTEAILQAMQEEGFTKGSLAEKLGKSRQYVSRVLNEEANFTIETMVQFCLALNRQLSLLVHRPEEMAVTKPRPSYLPWEVSENAKVIQLPTPGIGPRRSWHNPRSTSKSVERKAV